MNSETRASARRWTLLVLKALVSVLLLAYLIDRIDLSETLSQVGRLSWVTAAAGTALLMLYISVAGIRWLVVLRTLGADMKLQEALSVTFLGAFFNLVLPGTVGSDVARVWQSARAGLSLGRAVYSVVLERVGNLVGVSFLAAGGLSWWSEGRIPLDVQLPLWLIFAGVLTVAVGLTVLDRLPSWLRSIPMVARSAVLVHDSRVVFGCATCLWTMAITVVIAQALFALVVLLIAVDLHLQLSFWDCFLLVPAVLFVSFLPISLGGWGVREYAMVAALGFAGVPAASALLVSVTFAILNIFAALPGIFLWPRSRSLTQPSDHARS